MALPREGSRLCRPLGGLPLPGPPASLRRRPPRKGELETTKKHTGLSPGDAAVHTLPEEPLLHRCSTRPDVQQVAVCCLVTPLDGQGVDERLEAGRELAVLTKDQRRDAARALALHIDIHGNAMPHTATGIFSP